MRQILALLIVTVGFAPALHSQSTDPGNVFRDSIQSYELRHAKADAIVDILNEQFSSLVKFSGNSLTNTVYARVPEEAEPEVRAFIVVLEENAAKKAEHLRQLEAEQKDAAKKAEHLRRHEAEQEYTRAAEAKIERANAIHDRTAKADAIKAANEGFSLSLRDDNDSAPQSRYEAAEREAAKLADRWRRERARGRLPEQEMNKLRRRVNQQVASAFSLRQQMKRNDLAKATAQLTTIRERLDSRQKIAEQIVQRRVDDLLGDVDLSWLTAEDRAENDALDVADDATVANLSLFADNVPDMIMEKVNPAKGPVQIEYIKELGTIMLRGGKQDVENVMEVLKEIELTSDPIIRGKVIKINNEKGSILLDIGTDQGLRLRVPVDVFRNGKPIGRMEVISVAPKDSIARVLTTKSDNEVAVGDEVRASSRQDDGKAAQP
jgi:hypothetical protein